MKSIGSYAFYWCSSLTSLVIPNSVTNVGSYAFGNCSGLTSLTVNMPTIDEVIFLGCYNLTSLTIGTDVKSIIGGFSGCRSITTIMSQSPTPPTCQWPFDYNVYSQATLKVPEGSRTSYQMADYWKNFMNIEEFEQSGVQKVILDKMHNAPIYDLNGRKLKVPRKGINIIGGRKVIVK